MSRSRTRPSVAAAARCGHLRDECVAALIDTGSPAATSTPDVVRQARRVRLPVRQRDDDGRGQLDLPRRAGGGRGDVGEQPGDRRRGDGEHDGVDLEVVLVRAEHEPPAVGEPVQPAHRGGQPHVDTGGEGVDERRVAAAQGAEHG